MVSGYDKADARKSEIKGPWSPGGILVVCAIVIVTLVLFLGPVLAAGPQCGLYQYKAEIVRVIDGDTVVADIDLGFHTWRRDEHLRVNRIDAPEIRGAEKEAGYRSRQALIDRVEGQEVIVCTIKDRKGKFGRYLVEIWIGDENINDWMMAEGFAKAYDK